MKLNLKKLTVKDLSGESATIDLSKNFANYLYKATMDLGMLESAQTLYKKGEVELSGEQTQEVIHLLKHDKNCLFVAFVKQAIIELLETKDKES